MDLSDVTVKGDPQAPWFYTQVRDSDPPDADWEDVEGPVIVQPDGSWFAWIKGTLLALKPPGYRI